MTKSKCTACYAKSTDEKRGNATKVIAATFKDNVFNQELRTLTRTSYGALGKTEGFRKDER